MSDIEHLSQMLTRYHEIWLEDPVSKEQMFLLRGMAAYLPNILDELPKLRGIASELAFRELMPWQQTAWAALPEEREVACCPGKSCGQTEVYKAWRVSGGWNYYRKSNDEPILGSGYAPSEIAEAIESRERGWK